jgi:hypothetical protein
MGAEVDCKATLGRQSAEGKAMLETDFVQFRSESLKFKVAFADLKAVAAAGDFLDLHFEGKRARLVLGEKAAARWASKILNPPSRLDKLGVKPGTTVCLIGEFEAAFRREVSNLAGEVSRADLIFLAVDDAAELIEVERVSKRMRRDAGLWIVYPKGLMTIREIDVISAGRAAGLKDVKVVRFSDTHTALKFVVPVVAR